MTETPIHDALTIETFARQFDAWQNHADNESEVDR